MAIFSHMAPVPPGFKPKWRDFLEEHVALYRRMPEELTLCVEELVPWFIKKVTWKWEPWVGLKPDEEMAKVCVSFLACLLIVNRSKKDLEHFHTFVFHPASLKDDDGETWAGWANPRGYIEQSWPSTLRGMQDGEDNYCTTIHEFVHMIDYRDRSFESVPHFDSSSAMREYRAFLKSEYKDLCKAWEKVSGCAAIRKYATSDKAEFLTCATESFFENSERLKYLRPQVYSWMQRIYKMDTRQWADSHQWAERVSLGELKNIRNYQWDQWDFKTTWDSKSSHAELLWQHGISAKDYPAWNAVQVERRQGEERARIEREAREAAERAARERKEKKERERKEREAQEKRLEKEERERREEAERKWRERYLLNNRTVIVEYPNGMPQLKYKLVDGHREGLMQRWDEQGNLREETEYSRGRKQGMVTYYYPDGQ